MVLDPERHVTLPRGVRNLGSIGSGSGQIDGQLVLGPGKSGGLNGSTQH